jgi:NTE family protein
MAAAVTSRADLVFEGGGVKGIGLAGAFASLEEHGVAPERVAGTSAGAITAALVAAGYTSAELDSILLDLPFARFKDEDRVDRIPLIGHGLSLLSEWGVYEGAFLEKWMTGLLEAKGVTRFGQLADEQADSPAGRYRLRVIASDLTHQRMLVLPDDAAHLGLDPDEMEIARAVRMSMSIPIFFEPVIHENPSTGEEHVVVDGGLLSNFPVWLFDAHGRAPRWPTFGLLLMEPDPRTHVGQRLPSAGARAERGSLLGYVKSLALTAMEAHDRMYVERASYARTIPIPTLGVGTTEFEITPQRRDALYASGKQAADEFLATWDFDTYIREFRRGS